MQHPAPSSDPGVGGGYILQIIGKDVLTSTYGATAETLSTSTTTHVTKVSSSRVPHAPSLAAGLGKVTAMAQPWEDPGRSQALECGALCSELRFASGMALPLHTGRQAQGTSPSPWKQL